MSKKTIAKLAKRAAEKALRQNANSTTCGAFYQPRLPANFEQFKKPKK